MASPRLSLPAPTSSDASRQAEKQASRDADAWALASGSMSREDLARKNVFLSASRFDIDFDSAVPLR